MSKFVVVILQNETMAYEGIRALKALHAENSLTVYSMAVVAKDKDGKILVRETDESGAPNIALGALLGGLIGVFGGPVGLMAGVAGGALIGSMGDLFNLGLSTSFVEKVSTQLAPGKTAVIAEVDEAWQTPLDTRMEKLGGIVLRNWRGDFEDEQIALEIAAAKDSYEHLKAEYVHARDDAKAKLKAKVAEAKTQFENTETRAKARIKVLDEDLKEKVAVLEKQMVDAEASAKEKIVKQISTLKSDYKMRSTKLKQAWDLTKDALAA
jgi:uncharacterized membrane protein